ncbi:MAG: hypothetical protein H7Y27_03680 [Gemmatimonadaceae bacterium]|nr:hypothetical protein [Chitinophagaceae bacterium]
MKDLHPIVKTLEKLKCGIHHRTPQIAVINGTMNFVTCCSQFRVTLLPIAKDLIERGHDPATDEFVNLMASIFVENAIHEIRKGQAPEEGLSET